MKVLGWACLHTIVCIYLWRHYSHTQLCHKPYIVIFFVNKKVQQKSVLPYFLTNLAETKGEKNNVLLCKLQITVHLQICTANKREHAG